MRIEDEVLYLIRMTEKYKVPMPYLIFDDTQLREIYERHIPKDIKRKMLFKNWLKTFSSGVFTFYNIQIKRKELER